MDDKKAQSRLIFSIIIVCLIAFVGLVSADVWNAPTITLVSPASGTYTSLTNISFDYIFTALHDAVDDNSKNMTWVNATIFMDGIANATSGNTTGMLTNGTTYNFTLNNMSEIRHYWNIRIENATNMGVGSYWWAAENFTITVDMTLPVVVIANNSDTYLYNTADSLIVTAHANETNPDTCSLWVGSDSSPGSSANQTLSFFNDTNLTFAAVSGFENGERIDYTVSCTDLAGNIGWAGNQTTFYDLTDPSVETNYTNNTFKTGGIMFNFTVRDTRFLDSCSLYGNFNRTSDPVAGLMQLNQTIDNTTQKVMTYDIELNFSNMSLLDTNVTGIYQWNIWCNSSGGRTAWSNVSNLTLGVDSIPPTGPTIRYLSTTATNETGFWKKWHNMSKNMTTVDSTPIIRWVSVEDNSDVTMTIIFDDDPDLTSPDFTFTVTGTAAANGTLDMVNYTEVGVNASRPYQTYYYAINVTDQAGNTNWSNNRTTQAYGWEYRVNDYGVNLTGGQWNAIAETRNWDINISSIVKETGATYISIFNMSHDFETCSTSNHNTYACRLNVSEGDPLWIYVETNSSWEEPFWNATNWIIPDDNSVFIGYGSEGGLLNFTNQSTGWNYFSVMNWSDGCSYQDIQNLLNNSYTLGSYSYSGLWNVNSTGAGGQGTNGSSNMTAMSYLNISSGLYHPYFWDFGDPWNATVIPFRGVVAVWNNYTSNTDGSYASKLFNRSGC